MYQIYSLCELDNKIKEIHPKNNYITKYFYMLEIVFFLIFAQVLCISNNIEFHGQVKPINNDIY